MGRSVSRPQDRGTVSAFAHCETEESWEWSELLEALREGARRRWPSLDDCDRWAGRELHVIAEGPLASLVVAEYCGLVSVSLVPDPSQPLAQHWVSRAEAGLDALTAEVFGVRLAPVARFSNGEECFRRVP